MSSQPKVGPVLKISVPNFKATDFSSDIEKLGGLPSHRGRKLLPASGRPLVAATIARSTPRDLAGGDSPRVSLSPRPQEHKASIAASQVARSARLRRNVEEEGGDGLGGSISGGGGGYPDGRPSASLPRAAPMKKLSLDEWVSAISLFEAPPTGRGGRSAEVKKPSSSSPTSPSTFNAKVVEDLPLQMFDNAEDFETKTPEEWVKVCLADESKPQAKILHFVAHEWCIEPCWVKGYDESIDRYLVELQGGGEKQVRRLALCFNAESAANFAARVDACRMKKKTYEQQMAFISYIEADGHNDTPVAPLRREAKEKFIKHCLHLSHVMEARKYIEKIRELILEVEKEYNLSMKFSKVKSELIEGHGTNLAVVREDSPFALLLSSFLPKPVPAMALVQHVKADKSVDAFVDLLVRHPTLTPSINAVVLSVWRRFGEGSLEAGRPQILDTTRRGRLESRVAGASDQERLSSRVFTTEEFVKHMEEHRTNVTVMLERHWRDFIVSEILDKMSESSNFFVDNPQKHLKSPLHRVLRRFDLIMGSQMRWFVQYSLEQWIDFVRSFVPSENTMLPPPLLSLELVAQGTEVELAPSPDILMQSVLKLIDDVSLVTTAINCTEFEVVPFCNLTPSILVETSHAQEKVAAAKAATEEVVRFCLEGPRQVQQMYQAYAYLLTDEVGELNTHDVEAVRALAESYKKAEWEIERLTASVVKFPLFELHCRDVMTRLAMRANFLAKVSLDAVADSVAARSTQVLQEWHQTHERILSNPEDEEELAQLKQFMSDIQQLKTKPLLATTRHVHKQIDMLGDFSYTVDHEVVERAFSSFAWPLQIQLDVGESERSLDFQKQKFMDKLEMEKSDFEKDMARYHEEFDWVKSLGDFSVALKSATRITKLKDHFDAAKERVQSFVEREQLFGMEVSDYTVLHTMIENFEPFYKLWTLAIEFKHSEEEWLNGALAKLDAQEVETSVEEQFKESYKTMKLFEGQSNAENVARDLREAIGRFRLNMPVIQALCQEAFQPMHYIMLFDELDTDMDMEDGLTLQQLLEIGILDHIEKVERISDEAKKLHDLKTILVAMKKDWKPMVFKILPHQESDTYIVSSSDDIQMLLDDHIIKTQAIRGSPFVKPIEKEVRDWEAKLLYIQDLLEQWLQAQRYWTYLEPLFGSSDIQKQLPNEAKRFQAVNGLWRTTMDNVMENPNVLDVSDIENLLASFTDANKKLHHIQKGLNDYLRIKRSVFPRFYFLSNDELLVILSQSKDPAVMQPHMNKFFEGVGQVRFSPNNDVIKALVSWEGEVMELTTPVSVVSKENKGSVEKWLLEVELAMIAGVTRVSAASMQAYVGTDRTKWALDWLGQVVLCVGSIYWTQEVVEALNKNRLDAYHKQRVSYLNGIIDLVRDRSTTELSRRNLAALVTLDVHHRDVVASLNENKVSSSEDFEWISQLRYYWRPAGSALTRAGSKGLTSTKDKIDVCSINATLAYGCEYLGISERLVITPLTQRCYRTLMAAFHLHYGAAPEGPTGSGKTDTCKDLAKALAMRCVVLNCSNGVDYFSMAKIFKGLTATGCWCCLEDFDCVTPEVLSVVSHQVQVIQSALRAALRDGKRDFVFEDSEIQLATTCAICITMHPGYVGRCELPSSLSALFRPCAMMVPDYALISETLLYSFGFLEAGKIARKAVACLRLGSQQLSAQDHYDFGMRALKSVLKRADALRSKHPNRTELQVALTALNEVNLPMLTRYDIPLYKGIIDDLFHGVEAPPSDYTMLVNALAGSSQQLDLQPAPSFLAKCAQTWETMMVRHGLMIVGQTVSGKTAMSNVLVAASSAIADGGLYMPVTVHKMNPKSIDQGQLYGSFDASTHEWTDGILALAMRFAASAEPTRRQWVVLDGPVDAGWVENLNTVLDDNRKLCLNSGEIIKVTPLTTIIFEIEDLAVASPASVSRCGMAFMEQVDVGWQALMLSWLDKLPERVKEQRQQLHVLIAAAVEPTWEMISRRLHKPVEVNLNWLVLNLLQLMASLLAVEIPLAEGAKDLQPHEKESKLETIFWLSLFWSFGSTVDTEGRQKLNAFFRDLASGLPVKEKYHLLRSDTMPCPVARCPIAEDGTVFDYTLGRGTVKWEQWDKMLPSVDIPKDAAVHSIVVVTVDTMQMSYFMQVLIKSEHHMLFSGSAGTGKTVAIQRELSEGFDPEKFTNICLAFTAHSAPSQTQEIIDGRLDKRKKGTYGPPFGKRCIVFVDDLSMPSKERYGAQPPIELLRQWMDTGGWYERKTCEFRSLVDLQFVGAMAPSGGGRCQVTPRYLRHFNLMCLLPVDHASLKRIFTTIMNWFFGKFPLGVGEHVPSVVAATIEVFDKISAEMLPTPAKCHYTFNVRDMSKVLAGIGACSKMSLHTPEDLITVWIHETQRVYQDRLMNEQDSKAFNELLKTVVRSQFKTNWDAVVRREPLLFSSCLDISTDHYQEVKDIARAQDVLESYLMDLTTDANAAGKKQLQLVFFEACIEHVCRITRILKLPLGHAMLVGLSGSGRRSVATLAAFMLEFEMSQIEHSKSYGMNDWRNDLKQMLMRVAENGKDVAFCLADSQITQELFLENIATLLSAGEVLNLFNSEDKAQIVDLCTVAATAAGSAGTVKTLAYFTKQIRKHLHIILSISPLGEHFRERVRSFPPLVNCCHIDWFMEWPQSALRAVTDQTLIDVELDTSVFEGVASICVEMQRSIALLAKRFKNEVGRHFYITSTSYLELIESFKDLLTKKRKEVSNGKFSYDCGVSKVEEIEELIKKMTSSMDDKRPVLTNTQTESNNLLKLIEDLEEEASSQRLTIIKEETECNKQAEEVRTMKEEVQADLDRATPALNAALDALKQLKKSEISDIKNLKTAPEGVVKVSMALCIVFDVKPKKAIGADGRSKVDDYWEPAKKSIWGDAKLLDRLINYDKDHIPQEIIAELKPFEDDPGFDPEVIKKAAIPPVYSICKWVRAIIVYDEVAKVVGPKRSKLLQGETDLADVLAAVAEKKSQLKIVEDKVASLQDDFELATSKKQELESEVSEGSKRLARAEKLIATLGAEKAKWSAESAKLGREHITLTGDVLMAAGLIAYLGPFAGKYRNELVKDWRAAMTNREVPASKEFSLRSVVGNEVVIRQWMIDKLPSDKVSIENALIVSSCSRRWPLMIDPQMQANTWIRKAFAKDLKVLRLETQNSAKEIEVAISAGKAILLENVGEALDPLYEPLFRKATFKAATGLTMIRIGDSTIEYREDFRLLITTKLPNPHYSPQVCAQVTLVNFTATLAGLEDQLLGILVAHEEVEIERRRLNGMQESVTNKTQLKEIEDRILEQLSSSKVNILHDEELINSIATSKVSSQRIEERVVEQEKIQASVQEARSNYVAAVSRASAIFFTVADLRIADVMYQYSLQWYISVFELAIKTAPKIERNVPKRLLALQDQFLKLIFQKTSDSLFEKDKLLFSLLLCLKSMEVDNELNKDERDLLLRTGFALPDQQKPAGSNWLSEAAWARLCELDKLKKGPLGGMLQKFRQDLHSWQDLSEHENPLEASWPGGMKETTTPLQRALVMLALRPDCLTQALQEIVAAKLGVPFLEPLPFNLERSYADSKCEQPIILLLAPGADPLADIVRLADKHGMIGQKFQSMSLGDSQGAKAQTMVQESKELGAWVLLQNCHLARSWASNLESLVEDLKPFEMVDSFRLWLTAMPSPGFPVGILQNSMSLACDTPKGLKGHMLRSYLLMEEEWMVEACMKTESCQHAFRTLLFGLCFFHASILERCQYGTLGWNAPYNFTEVDRQLCVGQLRTFLEESDTIPLAALRYTVAEVNYGGRITDVNDRHLIRTLLSDFYCPEALKEDYKYSTSRVYNAPPFTTLANYISHIQSWPAFAPKPEVFGLHNNAHFAAAATEAARILMTAAATMPSSVPSSGGRSPESIIEELSLKYALELPDTIDADLCLAKYPLDYLESMNAVLYQEILRFNRLLSKVRSALGDVGKAIKGVLLMGDELESIGQGLLNNSFPEVWRKVSYASVKPLSSYFADLAERLKFFQAWVLNAMPPAYWISAFFSPQSFLTGQVQNCFRKEFSVRRGALEASTQAPPDNAGLEYLHDDLCFSFKVQHSNMPLPPPRMEVGCYIYGLFMVGARWYEVEETIAECSPKDLFSAMPYIAIIPKLKDSAVDKKHLYPCPVYKTSERRGTLSTGSQSSHFVAMIPLPILRVNEKHWTRRGVKCLLQSDE